MSPFVSHGLCVLKIAVKRLARLLLVWDLFCLYYDLHESDSLSHSQVRAYGFRWPGAVVPSNSDVAFFPAGPSCQAVYIAL